MEDAPRPEREEDSRPGSPTPAERPLDGPTQERLEFLTCDPFASDPSGPDPRDLPGNAE